MGGQRVGCTSQLGCKAAARPLQGTGSTRSRTAERAATARCTCMQRCVRQRHPLPLPYCPALLASLTPSVLPAPHLLALAAGDPEGVAEGARLAAAAANLRPDHIQAQVSEGGGQAAEQACSRAAQQRQDGVRGRTGGGWQEAAEWQRRHRQQGRRRRSALPPPRTPASPGRLVPSTTMRVLPSSWVMSILRGRAPGAAPSAARLVAATARIVRWAAGRRGAARALRGCRGRLQPARPRSCDCRLPTTGAGSAAAAAAACMLQMGMPRV